MQVTSMRRHWELMEVVPLQPMEVHGGANSHLQPRQKLTLEQKGSPKGRFNLVKSLQRSRLLAEHVALWRGDQVGAVDEEPQPVAGTDIAEVNEHLYG